jgi:hypothetical protein
MIQKVKAPFTEPLCSRHQPSPQLTFDYEVNRTAMEVNWIAPLYTSLNFQKNFKF